MNENAVNVFVSDEAGRILSEMRRTYKAQPSEIVSFLISNIDAKSMRRLREKFGLRTE